MKYRPTLYTCPLQERMLISIHQIRFKNTNVHFNDLKGGYYDQETRSAIYRHSTGFHYANTSSYLEKIVSSSDSIENLFVRICEMETWLFLNVGVQRYGFYCAEDEYINIRAYDWFLKIYPNICFEDEGDWLAFKLKYG